jgi:hypothetical protein
LGAHRSVSATERDAASLRDPLRRWYAANCTGLGYVSLERRQRVESGGLIVAPRMAGFGAQQKLVLEIGCFRFCPTPDPHPTWYKGRHGGGNPPLVQGSCEDSSGEMLMA